MSKQQQFEDIVKASLLNKAEKISPPDNMFENIKYEIQLNRSEKKFMLKEKFLPLNLNFKKSIIATFCSAFIISGSILAFSPSIRASALQIIDKHANGYIGMKSYDKAPSKNELKKDLGYEVKMPASLPEGYKLIDSGISGHIDGSAPPEKQYDKKEAGATYSKNKGRKNSVSLDVCKAGVKVDSPIFKNAKIVNIGNTTAYWAEYTIHILPVDVFDKMSQQQQDKIDEACKNGKEVLISVSSNNGTKLSEEFKPSHSLKWTQGNVNYRLTDENNKLTFDQMSKMAESIMNSK